MQKQKKNIYFVSDCHFGVPNYEASLIREKKFIQWLDVIQKDAQEIYLLGDIFDFWFEYKRVVPKGYVRLLGKLAEITDKGIPVYYFRGNHDMWMFDYFPKELNIPLFRDPQVRTFFGKKFFIAHGDGLGPGDKGYKFLRRIFSSRFLQWMFARLHPNFAIGLGLYFSNKSRYARGDEDLHFHGHDTEKERLIAFAKETLKQKKIDFFIFGHRHLPIDIKLDEHSRYINIGDWLHHFSYGVFDGENFEIKKFEPPSHS